MRQKMREDIKKMRESMDQMFGDFGKFDKMMDKFRQDFFNDDFFGGDFGDLFGQFDDLQFQRGRNYRWEETDKERLLIFNFRPVKD